MASQSVTQQPAPATAARRSWWPLVVIASAHLMVVLDTTVMFVALPSVQHSLGLSISARQWVVTAYTLALAGLLLLGGRLADRFGARRTLLIGAIGFACASAVGGASVDGAMLIAARAVQGAFGAVLISSTKSLLITVYTGEEIRARAISYFTATLTAGISLGLVLGGVLTSELSWRWCLYVNVALALVTVIGAPRVLPAPEPRPAVRIDLISTLLATAGTAALVYGLGEASAYGWGSAQISGSLAAAAVLLAGFVARQVGHNDRLLPLRIVLSRVRGWALLALIVNGLSTFGMLLILTYQLQSVMHYSALVTGLALIPFSVATTIGSVLIAPRLMPRVAARWLISISVLVEGAGLVPLAWLTPHSRYVPLILLATLVEGLSTGVAGPATLSTALRGVERSDTGAAGALTSAVAQLGSSLGAALLNTVAASTAIAYLAAHPAAGLTTATVHGFAVAMIWGALILLVAAIPVALFLRPRPAQAA
jgi:EmrB/QacA subfamily drug resistance transporter